MQVIAMFIAMLIAGQSNGNTGGLISGSVTDELGYPISDAYVRAYRTGYDGNGTFMVLDDEAKQPKTAPTDSHGEFRIEGPFNGRIFHYGRA